MFTFTEFLTPYIQLSLCVTTSSLLRRNEQFFTNLLSKYFEDSSLVPIWKGCREKGAPIDGDRMEWVRLRRVGRHVAALSCTINWLSWAGRAGCREGPVSIVVCVLLPVCRVVCDRRQDGTGVFQTHRWEGLGDQGWGVVVRHLADQVAVLPGYDCGVTLVLLSYGVVRLTLLLQLLHLFLTGGHGVDAVIVGLQILPLLLCHRCYLSHIRRCCGWKISVAGEPCGVACE